MFAQPFIRVLRAIPGTKISVRSLHSIYSHGILASPDREPRYPQEQARVFEDFRKRSRLRFVSRIL